MPLSVNRKNLNVLLSGEVELKQKKKNIQEEATFLRHEGFWLDERMPSNRKMF